LTEELQKRTLALERASAALEKLRSEADQCESGLRRELAGALQSASDAVAVADAAKLAEDEAGKTRATEAATAALAQEEMVVRWVDERAKLEHAHASAMDAQREDFKARLKANKDRSEQRLTDFKTRASSEQHSLQRDVDELRAKIERAAQGQEDAVRKAVRLASERADEHQRQIAANLKTAQALLEAKEAEFKKKYDDLARRFAARENMDEERLLQRVEEQRREIKHLQRKLHNREKTDQLFQASEFRRSRSRDPDTQPSSPSLPPLPLRHSSEEREGRSRTGAARRGGAGRGSSPFRAHSAQPLAR